MADIRQYVAATAADAFEIITERFSPRDVGLAQRLFANPMKPAEVSAGDVAYQDGRPVGFQAATLRQLMLDGEPIFGVNGGLLCFKEGASPVLLVALMQATMASRYGSVLYFANTVNPASCKMNKMLGVRGTGPRSCAQIRFAVTYCPRWLAFLLPKPVCVRLPTIDADLMDDFWKRYLKSSHGLVTSRTATELRWVFGDRLASDECVMFGSYRGSGLNGYIVIGRTRGGQRWMILDWIAIDDDEHVLLDLLVSAVRFVRRETRAIFLESIGFPEKAQSILAHALPFVRKAPSNSFIWKFTDGRNSGIPDGSWFFGPYDGDRCM